MIQLSNNKFVLNKFFETFQICHNKVFYEQKNNLMRNFTSNLFFMNYLCSPEVKFRRNLSELPIVEVHVKITTISWKHFYGQILIFLAEN